MGSTNYEFHVTQWRKQKEAQGGNQRNVNENLS